MRTISNNSSSVVELLKTVASRADSLTEGTKFLETGFLIQKAENQQIQELRDDERRGYLMQEIMRLLAQLGIPSGNQRVLKAMTTLQLEAYKEELDQQLRDRDRPFKHLSVA
ncbi:MAG: hypothetical protein V7K50_04740 [Nostoc sp.]|uniref:hypothetical protein n=1 Tax=Nostoc sp. TaxID=1180 RepID=UPI002FF7D42F